MYFLGGSMEFWHERSGEGENEENILQLLNLHNDNDEENVSFLSTPPSLLHSLPLIQARSFHHIVTLDESFIASEQCWYPINIIYFKKN